jgi:hypothetical protein
VGVEVRHVFAQHSPKLASVEDQHPIQQLAADGADPALGDRVRSGCAHRGAQDADGLAGEHGVEGIVNFMIRRAGMIAGLLPDEEVG